MYTIIYIKVYLTIIFLQNCNFNKINLQDIYIMVYVCTIKFKQAMLHTAKNPLTTWSTKVLKAYIKSMKQRVAETGTEMPTTIWHIRLQEAQQELQSR